MHKVYLCTPRLAPIGEIINEVKCTFQLQALVVCKQMKMIFFKLKLNKLNGAVVESRPEPQPQPQPLKWLCVRAPRFYHVKIPISYPSAESHIGTCSTVMVDKLCWGVRRFLTLAAKYL
jgi:hypothetical protein